VSDLLSPNQVAARLDRLPPSPFHRRFLALIALGTWFDYYDNFVAGALAVSLPAAGVVPPAEPREWVSPLGLFMASLPLGMFLGTVFLGMASDYFGRRFGFIAMLLLYSLASLAGGAGYYLVAALAGSGVGFGLLLVTRLLAGAGIGAENVIIDAYVTEMVPRQVRGRSVALVHAFAFTAFPAAALLASMVAGKDNPQGWWLLLVFGSLGALFSWYFRRRLPESPRWAASVGRHTEAAKDLARIEQAVEESTGRPLPPVETVPPQPAARPVPFREIWSPPYRGRTIMLLAFQLLQTVGYYGFIHGLGLLFQAKGFPEDALTMQAGSALLAPVGPLIGVWSVERWQRKWLLVGLAAALALGYVVVGLAADGLVLILLAAAVIVGSNWFSAVFHAYQAELFPTAARATGVGFTYSWSRVTMMGLNLVLPGLIATNVWGALGLMAAAMCGVAGIVGVFGPLTNAKALEESH
jgi:putative MFS transporter